MDFCTAVAAISPKCSPVESTGEHFFHFIMDIFFNSIDLELTSRITIISMR